ncbi:MAG TPA: M24 family metallopeptidase [Caulobacteraceae bacterium]|jgi:Xaa-Pro aminopeptidase|nr:M24 family metallopeptidase [Caulobacteraceae bacterium]
MTDQLSEEAVGEHYDAAMLMETRARTRAAIHMIADGIAPGMTEAAAVELAQGVLAAADMQRGWHGVYVRFGENTLKTFGKASEDTTLGENDIFFIDIGPVWRKWEGDGGDTFVIGDDADMHAAARDVRTLFDRVQDRWRTEHLSGAALYDHATKEAERMGWLLNLDMAGHRLSDFPHSAIYKGPLAQAPYSPSSGLWVLEIQIRHPDRPFGAFYEDLMLDAEA